MNHDTKHNALPSLVGDVLADGSHTLDNFFATTWRTRHLTRLLKRAGFSKRSGIEAVETVFVLMGWKWLHVASVAMFCRQALAMFSRAKKDVPYDFLKREDVNWRKLNLHTVIPARAEQSPPEGGRFGQGPTWEEDGGRVQSL